jgi:hypothetical protein
MISYFFWNPQFQRSLLKNELLDYMATVGLAHSLECETRTYYHVGRPVSAQTGSRKSSLRAEMEHFYVQDSEAMRM